MPRTSSHFLAPSLASLLALVPACLTPPVLPPRPDGGSVDGTAPASFRILSVKVRDASGLTWDDDAPRLPSIVVRFTEPPEATGDALLLAGETDDDLLGDLAEAPLRAATIARRIGAQWSLDDATLTLVPDAPLLPGATLTLALPAWLSSARGARLGAAFAQTFTISTAPGAGARATDSWPPDGAFGVPTSLALVALRFDGDVPRAERAITLTDASGARIEGATSVVACTEIGWPDGTCAMLTLATALAPMREHVVTFPEGTVDATGAPLPPMTARFVTSDDHAAVPIEALALTCIGDEHDAPPACVRADDESIALRLALSGPARFAWTTVDRSGSGIAPRGDVAITLTALDADTGVDVALRAMGYDGRETPFALQLATTEPLVTLSIAEVRADPRGPEPRQEYVELWNYGAIAVDLAGLSLSDSAADGDALPPLSVAPGARVLVVTDDFDPDDRASGDVPVPAATPLARVDHTLCSGGLSNAGEPVFLRDALHRRISAAPATPPPIEGSCIVRTASSMRTGEPGAFEYAPLGTCTPGR